MLSVNMNHTLYIYSALFYYMAHNFIYFYIRHVVQFMLYGVSHLTCSIF